MTGRRPKYSGMVRPRADGRFEGRLTVAGATRSVYGATEAVVEAKLRDLRSAGGVPPAIRHSVRHPAATSVGVMAVRALEEAAARRLSREDTVRLVVASIRSSRVRRGIFGPCVYCGDLFADSVDHRIPLSRGGTDDPANCVSSCWPCNVAKADQLPEEWEPVSGHLSGQPRLAVGING